MLCRQLRQVPCNKKGNVFYEDTQTSLACEQFLRDWIQTFIAKHVFGIQNQGIISGWNVITDCEQYFRCT